MPQFAIKSTGIKSVATSTIIGRSTAGTGSAEQLSASTAKTLLGLASADKPTFAAITQLSSSSADPTTGDVSAGTWQLHKNTTSSKIYLAVNDSGSIVKQELGITGGGSSYDQDLNTDDDVRFANLEIGGANIDLANNSDQFDIACGGFSIVTNAASGTDAAIKLTDGSSVLELHSTSSNNSPYLRIGGTTPGTSRAATVRFQETGGVTTLNVGDKDGVKFFQFGENGGTPSVKYGFHLRNDGFISWSSGTDPVTSPDIQLRRGGAGILEQRSGTDSQSFQVYNTYTDSSNYERGVVNWNSNELEIGSQATGTGTLRDVEIIGASLKCAIATINFSNLPTSDPSVAGQVWVDSGGFGGAILKLSAG